MNSWNFTGNLGRDAETSHTAAGDAVVSFSVAVKAGYGNNAKTTWAKCTMWGKRGESVAQYLTKGQLVGIVGELSLNEYTKKDGTPGASVEVRVNDLTLLGKRDDSVPSPVTEHGAGKANAFQSQDIDDDIPF